MTMPPNDQSSAHPSVRSAPDHPSVPIAQDDAVARSGGQGRPSGRRALRALPLTAASTAARCRHRDLGGRWLVRVAVIALLAAGPAWADSIDDALAEASQRFDLPVAWLRAVMQAESDGDIRALSDKGAIGLMQVMPATYAEQRAKLGLGADPREPRDNILAGAGYLREMLDRFGVPGFLAAYNAGPGRYEQHRSGGRPLPAETRRYLDRLLPAMGLGRSSAAMRDPRTAPLFVARQPIGVPPISARSTDVQSPDRPPNGIATIAGPDNATLFVQRSMPGVRR